jgi:hypothetical protein
VVVDTSTLDDLILGRGVKRGRHDLPSAAVALFRERLIACRFVETTVGDVPIETGERVPAWLLRGNVADFGTVFWEIFTERYRRKLFGSQVRNRKGDWEIQIPPASKEQIWAGLGLLERYDASRPVGMW